MDRTSQNLLCPNCKTWFQVAAEARLGDVTCPFCSHRIALANSNADQSGATTSQSSSQTKRSGGGQVTSVIAIVVAILAVLYYLGAAGVKEMEMAMIAFSLAFMIGLFALLRVAFTRGRKWAAVLAIIALLSGVVGAPLSFQVLARRATRIQALGASAKLKNIFHGIMLRRLDKVPTPDVDELIEDDWIGPEVFFVTNDATPDAIDQLRRSRNGADPHVYRFGDYLFCYNGLPMQPERHREVFVVAFSVEPIGGLRAIAIDDGITGGIRVELVAELMFRSVVEKQNTIRSRYGIPAIPIPAPRERP